jgi:hypothetical protein
MILILLLSASAVPAREQKTKNSLKVGDCLWLPASCFFSGGEISLSKDSAYIRMWIIEVNSEKKEDARVRITFRSPLRIFPPVWIGDVDMEGDEWQAWKELANFSTNPGKNDKKLKYRIEKRRVEF